MDLQERLIIEPAVILQQQTQLLMHSTEVLQGIQNKDDEDFFENIITLFPQTVWKLVSQNIYNKL